MVLYYETNCAITSCIIDIIPIIGEVLVMKLISFRTEQAIQLGVVTERGVLPVTGGDAPSQVDALIRGGEDTWRRFKAYVAGRIGAAGDEAFLDEQKLDIAPCVQQPGKIICVGLNYRKHAEESNMPVPETPVLFNKFPNGLAGHGDTVLLPKGSEQNDYEAELAIVIGKKAKHVSREEALDYVFGYCNANDLSSRDWQFRTNQWLLGKCCDGFCPVGPYLVTADEIPDPNRLRITCTVNGELRQNSNTSDMIFDCRTIISYISQHLTLEPGDLILTGTPEGVIHGYPKDRQVWLKDGDVVTIEIEGLGKLTNTMKREV